MIASISINFPRKITSSFINTILFGKNIKNIKFKKYDTVALLTLLCLFAKTQTVFAQDANLSHGIVKYYEQTMDFFEIIGFPTIDVFFNLLRMHKPLIDYLNVKAKSL